MPSAKKIITREDVAKLANVSHMTVTRVLNGEANVSEKTRKRVLEACDRLQFRKNLVASSLRSRKSHAIAVIIPTFRHELYSRLLSVIEEEAQKKEYCIIASQLLRPDQAQAYLSWSRISELLCRNVDGIILDCDLTPEMEERLAMESVPLVCINRYSPLRQLDTVVSDYRSGFSNLTRLLIRNGHKNIIFAGGIAGRAEFSDSLAGYQEEMLRNGLTPVQHGSGYSFEDGIAIADDLIHGRFSFSAVMGSSDYVAVGLISRFQEYGLQVPSDISVTGFAGDSITQFYHPAITTAQQPVQELALTAVQRLMYRIAHPDVKDKMTACIPVMVLERQSVRKL